MGSNIETKDYSMDTVLSADSLEAIRWWNPRLARMLDFFSEKLDTDRRCPFLLKVVKIFNDERRQDRHFDRYYQEQLGPPDGVSR